MKKAVVLGVVTVLLVPSLPANAVQTPTANQDSDAAMIAQIKANATTPAPAAADTRQLDELNGDNAMIATVQTNALRTAKDKYARDLADYQRKLAVEASERATYEAELARYRAEKARADAAMAEYVRQTGKKRK